MKSKNKFNIKIYIIVLLTVLCLILMIKEVNAYYYSDILAKENKSEIVKIAGGGINTITQKNGDKLKVIIKNQGQIENYLRIKIFSVSPVELLGEDWEQNEDGYYYSKSPIKPGETIENLSFKISNNNSNIITIIESTQVLYGKYDEPYADWNKKIDI